MTLPCSTSKLLQQSIWLCLWARHSALAQIVPEMPRTAVTLHYFNLHGLTLSRGSGYEIWTRCSEIWLPITYPAGRRWRTIALWSAPLNPFLNWNKVPRLSAYKREKQSMIVVDNGIGFKSHSPAPRLSKLLLIVVCCSWLAL